MTNEELAVQAQQGDKLALEKLWLQVYKLLYLMCNRAYTHYGCDFCSRKGVTLEDFTQESYFAFLKAVEAFKSEKEYKFNTYLEYHLKTAINALLGQRTSKKEPLNYCGSLDVPMGEDEDLNLCDVLEDEDATQAMQSVEEKTDNELLREALTEALDTCTARQQTIISLRYYYNRTLKEVSEVINVHPSRVREVEQTAFRRMRSGKGLRLLKPFFDEYITTELHKGYPNIDETIIKREHFQHMKERLYI
nr:MAG TPA: DNA directed RNA polymerase subunit [Caudoviricetes sp.]